MTLVTVADTEAEAIITAELRSAFPMPSSWAKSERYGSRPHRTVLPR